MDTDRTTDDCEDGACDGRATPTWESNVREIAKGVLAHKSRGYATDAALLARFVIERVDDVESVRAENARLREQLRESRLTAQVDELQASMTRMTEASLYRVVRRFHQTFGHPVEHTPRVPDEAQVRFRVALIFEEFTELVESCLELSPEDRGAMWQSVRYAFDNAKLKVDLPEAYDALLDLAWVIEGTHAVFGTRAEPGIAEVARANMSKDPVYVAAKDEHHRRPDPTQKPTKPEEWTPPDIRRVLIDQGWKP